jgi:homoserine kinase type II
MSLITDDAPPVDVLEATFPLGDWQDVERLPAGKSQHYLVTTSLGRFVVRRSYRSKQPDDVRFEHELVAHLRAEGFPGPEFVPTTDGEPYACLDGRLWRTAVFVSGRSATIADAGDAEAAARALARYHQIVEGFRASVPTPTAPFLPEALTERLAAVDACLLGEPPADLAAPLRFARDQAAAVITRLEELYREIPVTTIHAGCRRGSTLFDGDRIAVVLDFDSAHEEARALDVAVAVHDFAKLYGDPGSDDYKVHLDRTVAGRFVAAYHSLAPLSAAEVEAIPMLLVAKRLKRALGRFARLLSGEPLSVNDHKKIALELARVRSLTERDGLLENLRCTSS